MNTSSLATTSHSPLYEKAMEIFALSKNISNYLMEDISLLEKDGKEHAYVYVAGDIVQQSVSLVPEIMKAEQWRHSDKKHKYAASVTRLANRLYRNCERLELINNNGRDFIPILQKELKKFRKLQRHWMLTL
ncbi:hypothetical protein [Altibacter sp. HG106]|uniref:hypothetical protein n=1 Tax=Altibacter sp. HG106 TaxID=3023937 RepID=UPI002350931F|nr:hypothetical protein [Altibacter sp. HG106]MDC7995788.1 hypothetical protein [Altibacter sp. HG106]